MLYLVLYIAFMFIFIFSMRGTVFEVSLIRNRLGGVLIFRELFFLVLLGAVFFSVMGVSRFNVVHVREEDVHKIGAVVFCAVFLLFASIAAFSKTIFWKYLSFNKMDETSLSIDRKTKLLLYSVFIVIVLLVVTSHLTGTSHAFIKSIIAGESLLSVRLANRYSSYTPSHINVYLSYACSLGAILIGCFGRRMFSTSAIYVFLLLILYAASMGGGKAPVVQTFVLYFLGHVMQRRYSALSLLVVSLVMLVATLGVVYITVRVQYPGLDFLGFSVYLMDRLGVGQIQGVYEQFSLGLRDFSYIFIEIPFSGYFVEPKMFSKDLMMNTFAIGRNYDETGVMNSLFIGEAYAIGGYVFALMSPIFVAFNYCAVCCMAVYIFQTKFGFCASDAKRIAPVFSSSILMFTGDFNGMLMGKRLIFVASFFVFLYLVSRAFSAVMGPYFRGNIKIESSRGMV